MTERENFDKYDNLGENKLNTKSNKEVDVRNDVMTSGIKRCRGERKIDGFRKKLMIPESEISECSNTTSNQKKENTICQWKNSWRKWCQNLLN